MGVFKAISKPFKSKEKIFPWGGVKGRELYPYRVKLEPVILVEKPLKFNELVPKLSFIKNKAKWVGYVRRPMVAIPKRDFDLIMKRLSEV